MDKYIKEIVGILEIRMAYAWQYDSPLWGEHDKWNIKETAKIISKIPCPKCKKMEDIIADRTIDILHYEAKNKELKETNEELEGANRMWKDEIKRLEKHSKETIKHYDQIIFTKDLGIQKLKDELDRLEIYTKEVNDELCAENKRLGGEVERLNDLHPPYTGIKMLDKPMTSGNSDD